MNDSAKVIAIRECVESLQKILGSTEALSGTLKVRVVSEDSDPHKVNVFDIAVSPESLRIETIETNRLDRTAVTYRWDDLLQLGLLRARLLEEQALLDELREEARSLGAPPIVEFKRPD